MAGRRNVGKIKVESTVINPSNIKDMWRSIILNSHEDKDGVVFVISDVDGTLNENDQELCRALEEAKKAKESISFMIATGRTCIERKYSTHHKEDCLAKHSPIMICQGGALVTVSTTHGQHNYVIPMQEDINQVIDDVAKAFGLSRQAVFREEHLGIQYYLPEEGREVIGVPIAEEDEDKLRAILEQYDGSIVEAWSRGVLPCYDIAIEEYIERGMPPEAIEAMYESEMEGKIITEITIVCGDLTEAKCPEMFKGKCRIQHQIGDRYPGTRGSSEGVRPDIADIVTIGKKGHVEAIVACVKELGGITIGLGDQFNDDFLNATTYSFVANAAPIGAPGSWNFAVSMAREAAQGEADCERSKIIHARHGYDGNLLNWAVEAIVEAREFESIKSLCDRLSGSKLNMALRKWLQEGAMPNTSIELD